MSSERKEEIGFLRRLLKNLIEEKEYPPRYNKIIPGRRIASVNKIPARQKTTPLPKKTQPSLRMKEKKQPPPRDSDLPVSRRKKPMNVENQNNGAENGEGQNIPKKKLEVKVQTNDKERKKMVENVSSKGQKIEQKKVKKQRKPKTVTSDLNDTLENFLRKLERTQDVERKWKINIPENPYFAEFDVEDLNNELNNVSILEEVGTCCVVVAREKNILIGTSLGFILHFVNGEMVHVFGSLELSIHGKNVTSLDLYREHFILSGHTNGVMIVWDLRTGKSVLEVNTGLRALLSVKFLDHKTFLFCDYKGVVQIFNCETGNFTDLSPISPTQRVLRIDVSEHNTVFLLNKAEVIVLTMKGKGLVLLQRIPVMTPTSSQHIPYLSCLREDIFERKILLGYGSFFRIYKFQQTQNRFVMAFHYDLPKDEEVVTVQWLKDAVLVITQPQEGEWNDRFKKFYVIDRFDDTQNVVGLKRGDGFVIGNFDINFSVVDKKQLFHSFCDSWGNNLYIRGKRLIFCFNFDTWRQKLRKYFQRNQWRKGFELGCFNFFHGLSVIFNIPKKQITDYLVPNIQRYINYVILKTKSVESKSRKLEEEEEMGGEDDDNDEEEGEILDLLVACENCFTYLIHVNRVDYIFNELYELMAAHKTVFYDSLFRQMEKSELTEVPIRLLDEFFEHGKRILDFEKILLLVDITQSPEMIDKLIEKCQVHEDYYGCYVSVYAKGKGDFLTPLRFLISQPKHTPKVRQEIIQIVKLALSLRPAYAPDVIGLIFKESLPTVLSSPKTCQVFLNLFFDMVHRLRLLRRTVYDMYVQQLIRTIDTGASSPDSRTDELYHLLAKLISESHIRIKDKHLLERVSDYLLTPRENPDLEERQRLLSSLFEKTHPLFQDKYPQYIQSAKAVKMHGIVVQLCRKSGNSAEILRNLFLQLADRSKEYMSEDIEFLLNFRERVQWVYDELRTKISETSGRECSQSKIFLEMFLARVMDDERADDMLRPIILSDPYFHMSYMELLVECKENERLMKYLKKHYGTTLNHIKSEDLFRICHPVDEARLFLFAKAGNIQELLNCVLENIKSKRSNFEEQLQFFSPELERKLAMELKTILEKEDKSSYDELEHPVFSIQYYKFILELDTKLERLRRKIRRKRSMNENIEDSDEDDEDDEDEDSDDDDEDFLMTVSKRTPEFCRSKKIFSMIPKEEFKIFFRMHCPGERYPHVVDFDFTSVANVKLLLPFEEEEEERVKHERLPLPKFKREAFFPGGGEGPSEVVEEEQEKEEEEEEKSDEKENEDVVSERGGDRKEKKRKLDRLQKQKKEGLDVLEIPSFDDLRFTIEDSIRHYLKPSSSSIDEKSTLQRFWFEFLDQSVLIPLLELRYCFLFDKIPSRKVLMNYDFDDDCNKIKDDDGDVDSRKKLKNRVNNNKKKQKKKKKQINNKNNRQTMKISVGQKDFLEDDGDDDVGGDDDDDIGDLTDEETEKTDKVEGTEDDYEFIDEDDFRSDDEDDVEEEIEVIEEDEDELGKTIRIWLDTKKELEQQEEEKYSDNSPSSENKRHQHAKKEYELEEKRKKIRDLKLRIDLLEKEMREEKMREQKERKRRNDQFDSISKLTNLYLQRGYTSLLQMILEPMKEYIEVPIILKKLVVDYSFEKFIHLKRMVYLLLYDFDENILLTRKTKSLLSEDILATFNSYYGNRRGGWVTRKKTCCKRNCSIVKNEESIRMVTFRCGHIFHVECLLDESDPFFARNNHNRDRNASFRRSNIDDEEEEENQNQQQRDHYFDDFEEEEEYYIDYDDIFCSLCTENNNKKNKKKKRMTRVHHHHHQSRRRRDQQHQRRRRIRKMKNQEDIDSSSSSSNVQKRGKQQQQQQRRRRRKQQKDSEKERRMLLVRKKDNNNKNNNNNHISDFKNRILFSKKIGEWEDILGLDVPTELTEEETKMNKSIQRGLKRITMSRIKVYDKYNL